MSFHDYGMRTGRTRRSGLPPKEGLFFKAVAMAALAALYVVVGIAFVEAL